ncbi:hypothetical protein BJX66DRAFT_343063 [Aspergillus keveii]|uniref:Uncharacterized protein n=1 Tax=Aspergillus keveii TaxID=714993 RepID=A0ABR4FQF6_9EURO
MATILLGALSTVPRFVFNIAVYPIYFALYHVVYYTVYCAYFLLGLLASPFINLARLVLWFVLLPLRVLVNSGALFIYLGVASLMGAGIGAFLYFMVTFAIDWAIESRPWRPQATPRLTFRTEHREKAKHTSSLSSGSDSNSETWNDWGWELDPGGLRKRGVLAETIIEEESQESEFESLNADAETRRL